MQVVFDFVTGKIGTEEFEKAWYANPEIGRWIENLVDLKAGPTPAWSLAPYSHYRMAIYKHYNGSVLKFMQRGEELINQQNRGPAWTVIGWRFFAIASVVTVAYPEIVPTKYYDEEIDFQISVIGNNIGGVEVDKQVDTILKRFPREMGKIKRRKAAKAAIREYFHIQGSKYPQWVQEPEWPMGENSPMEYISRKRTGELVQFTFRDVDTQKTRIVEQYY